MKNTKAEQMPTRGITLVFANARDEAAEHFVRRFPPGRAMLITGLDLAYQEWNINFDDFDQSVIKSEGETFDINQITGVVSLTPAIYEDELVNIQEPDRSYIARELNAFFTYFFTNLNCPLMNRPVIGNFLGSNWRHETWLYVAGKCGFIPKPITRSTATPNARMNAQHRNDSLASITVIGDCVLGTTNETLIEKSKALTQRAGLSYLRIFYEQQADQFIFHDISLRPSIDDPKVADKIIQTIAL